MKPTVVCHNFNPPEDLTQFMKEAIGEMLQMTPYDSHLEASITKELDNYVMTVLIKYPGGQFTTTLQDTDLRRTITGATANIFTQVRDWRKSRFDHAEEKQVNWAQDFLENKIEGTSLKPKNAGGALRVLIVDDDVESVRPLMSCLQRLGCSTFVVSNGYEAIFEMVSNNRTYDVVILDWSMPEMTGGQALFNAQKVISYSPVANHHWAQDQLPVITYSSRKRSEIEIPKCEVFRHVDHWEKPVSYSQLFSKVTDVMFKLEESLRDEDLLIRAS